MVNNIINDITKDELAYPVWKNKYADVGETHPDDMHWRLAKQFSTIEEKYIRKEKSLWNKLTDKKNKLSDYGRKRQDLTLPVIYSYFKDFSQIVPQGSIMSMLGKKNTIGSLSNCFVVGQPEDSYGGILYKDQQLAQLMKRRGGVGLDISTLRPRQTHVSNAAQTSTGAASFMERFSNTTREVAQEGRRGALMLSIDCRHPDVLEFINAKVDRTKVTGANISVMCRDEFMRAAINDEDYCLRWPCDMEVPDRKLVHKYGELVNYRDGYIKWVKAKDIYNAIIKNAWDNAEPGQLFLDKHIDNSPDGVYDLFRMITTNPCGEIGMSAYDACRLLALNLTAIVKNPFTPHAEIDWDKFYELAYEQQRLADDIVDLEIQHIERIIAKIESDPESPETKQVELDTWKNILNIASQGRRTGCGITGLGDMLAMLNLKYDSAMAKTTIHMVFQQKFIAEFDCTTDLAILRGPFPGWKRDKEYALNNPFLGLNNFFENLRHITHIWSLKKMLKYGRRNISWSTVAPTGTVSLMTGTTSGIEPLFMPYYTRRRKINPSDKEARVDFTDQNGDTWQEYPVLHPLFRWWIENVFLMEINGFCFSLGFSSMTDFIVEYGLYTEEFLRIAFEKSPWYGSTANDIDWNARVEIQSIIQHYTTHSISSTLNLPNSATEKDIEEIYRKAWELGLKGVTVYRDGCRTGVLVSNATPAESKFSYKDTHKRPKELVCDFYHAMSNGKGYDIFIGLIDEKPYEVFARPSEEKNAFCRGTLTKVKKGVYKFESDDLTIDNVITDMSEEQEIFTRLISGNLRSGHDVKHIVKQLNSNKGALTSFTKVIARHLKKYIPDGTSSGIICNECGGNNVIFEEGCNKCLDCGNSKCG